MDKTYIREIVGELLREGLPTLKVTLSPDPCENNSEILAGIIALRELLINKNQEDFLNNYVPEAKFRAELGISRKQSYNIRQRGEIGYFVVGRKIYFSKDEITLFMTRHYINPTKQ